MYGYLYTFICAHTHTFIYNIRVRCVQVTREASNVVIIQRLQEKRLGEEEKEIKKEIEKKKQEPRVEKLARNFISSKWSRKYGCDY